MYPGPLVGANDAKRDIERLVKARCDYRDSVEEAGEKPARGTKKTSPRPGKAEKPAPRKKAKRSK